MHGDLYGLISPLTPAGNNYFLLLVNKMSRFMWLTLLRMKADAPTAIIAFQARVERKSDKKLKVLRINNGGEFTSVEFGEHYAGEGTEHHFSAPYSLSESDDRGDVKEHSVGSRDARTFLGGGGAHCHLPPQPGTD